MYQEVITEPLEAKQQSFLKQQSFEDTVRELSHKFATKQYNGKRYRYSGMSDSEVECMALERLPREAISIDNARLYMSIFRKLHDILNSSVNIGEATGYGADKLSFMLDYIEQNASQNITPELLIMGSRGLELAERERRGIHDTHLHDLMMMDGDDDRENADRLLRYYEKNEETGKHRALRGEIYAMDMLLPSECY
ncbi:hypothetical protein RsTz2092_12920 [Deferribacterales bacterium RsTz2092]|nr:hypothetical protein AGMMS49941_12130 [Deferribacterales bacterium]